MRDDFTSQVGYFKCKVISIHVPRMRDDDAVTVIAKAGTISIHVPRMRDDLRTATVWG